MEKILASEISKTAVKDKMNFLKPLSSDEEEADDASTIRNVSEANHQGMKPKLTQFQKKTEGDDDPNLVINRGFYVPKLAGFEYLEGPEVLQQATKKLKIQKIQSENNRNRNANADLFLSNSPFDAKSFLINDDDENFMYED